MNIARPNDFTINVSAGSFRFNRKTYGSQIRIDAEVARILAPLNGAEDPTMNLHALLIGYYKALVVECPLGWEDLENIDLSADPSLDQKILEVYFALRAKLDSFRVRREPEGANAPGEAPSQDAVPNAGVLAAQQVGDGANGPALAGAHS